MPEKPAGRHGRKEAVSTEERDQQLIDSTQINPGSNIKRMNDEATCRRRGTPRSTFIAIDEMVKFDFLNHRGGRLCSFRARRANFK